MYMYVIMYTHTNKYTYIHECFHTYIHTFKHSHICFCMLVMGDVVSATRKHAEKSMIQSVDEKAQELYEEEFGFDG